MNEMNNETNRKFNVLDYFCIIKRYWIVVLSVTAAALAATAALAMKLNPGIVSSNTASFVKIVFTGTVIGFFSSAALSFFIDGIRSWKN